MGHKQIVRGAQRSLEGAATMSRDDMERMGSGYSAANQEVTDAEVERLESVAEFKTCRECGERCSWQEGPSGGSWVHDEQPADGHDAVAER
jgi:hypothetical protein